MLFFASTFLSVAGFSAVMRWLQAAPACFSLLLLLFVSVEAHTTAEIVLNLDGHLRFKNPVLVMGGFALTSPTSHQLINPPPFSPLEYEDYDLSFTWDPAKISDAFEIHRVACYNSTQSQELLFSSDPSQNYHVLDSRDWVSVGESTYLMLTGPRAIFPSLIVRRDLLCS